MKLKFTIKQYLYMIRNRLFPFRIFTHMTGEELFKLHFFASSLQEESVFVEIGSYLGASSIFIASGLNESSKLYCVDTWQNDAMTERNRDTFLQFVKNVKKYKTRIIPIRKTSVDAAKNFDLKIDALFIDGDHSYEGVKEDVSTWLSKMKSNSLIVFHDSGWAEGVQRVIKEDIKPITYCEGNLPNLYWAWIK